METLSIVLLIPLAFAAAKLLAQLAGANVSRRDQHGKLPPAQRTLEHPVHSRIEGLARTRTDRRDLQLAIGQDFAAPDVEDRVWPRNMGC